ncbi:DUF4349 domain-containing protein [Acidaminobacter sp. JC074]|uniref:DUF4349 domain-containing protein n=1 Tax=Acidaminobacter sp. JC074 TaxID=2530199 RepID=UPI001F0E317B|nr:DUF4349 domain-containing protein [Acidaminobacter sp. JC074]MCH4888293.1 DUF4349 domain-containing protein [Acidaminobacter sp. JC074]
MKKILSLLLVAVSVFGLVACGSSDDAGMANSADYNYAVETEEAVYETEASMDDFGGTNYTLSESKSEAPSEPMADRMIIKSASMELQTLEYDLAVQRLNDKIVGVGGYIESSNVRGKDIEDSWSTRSAHFTLRIPAKQFEQFMSDMTTVGTVIQSNTYGEDVTAQVFDHEAHKKTLEVQEERLLNILSKAEKIEDIITLERELSNIRYQIENLTGTLKRLENLVSYSTLSVSIYEVHEIVEKEETPKTLGERIAAKFNDSLEEITDFFEGFAVWAIGSIPLLVIYVPLLFILILVGKKIYRKVFPKEVHVQAPEEKK